jgi:hypothetical protein
MFLCDRFAIMIELLACGMALCSCAAKAPEPVSSAPATIVQAPDPAVLHRLWENGYAAGYGAAESLAVRRNEQQQDQLNNVPKAVIAPAPAIAPGPTPIAAAPPLSGFQPIGPATPVSAGD